MSDVQLTEAFFQKAAGWEAVQQARQLLAGGQVLSSHWSPPLLKGVVQAGDTSYRAGLVIRSHLDIDNLCPCRQAREAGTLCAHSVALGLHHLRGPAPAATARPSPSPTPGPGGLPRPAPPPAARPGLRLRRDPAGTPLEIAVLFPPNLPEALARGRVTLVFEGVAGRQRSPLNALVKGGPFRLDAADLRLLDAAEAAAGGDTPGLVQLSLRPFLDLLPALAGHPRLSLGRQTTFEVDPRPAPVPWRARLEPDGVITVALADARPPGGLVREGDQAWILEPRRLRRFPLPSAFAGILEAPLRIPRMQVPLFLAHGWPQLAELGPGDSDFAPGDFVLTPQPPRFLLQLSGGLAQLAGTLQCAYGPRVMTVGVTAREDGAWIPDPADPRRYSTRDLAAEQHALQRLRQAGFAGPNAQGQVQLVGQERVLAFFARDYPRLEKEWSVTLEERLERTTRQTFDRVTPQLRITSSGQQWFDLEVGYASEGGERLGPAELQQLLRGGGRRLRNGRIALLDSGAVEEIQQVLVDCTPAQSAAGDAVRYRMEARQAGYLQSSLREKGLALQAPAAWSDRSRRQAGEVSLECPPLGDLEPVLRPYQRHGVAWLRF
ncbi:MAG: SNF2 helicase associated domain-containing protein, partial [Verrucomicrobiota bacterium]